MRIAYLTNQYPAVSHSFIRREIHALEERGVEVKRYTVRRSPYGLIDPEDIAEAAQTRVILGAGTTRIGLAVLGTALSGPGAFLKAASLAWRTGQRSEKGRFYQAFYLAEACVLRQWLARDRVDHLHAHFGTNSATVAMLCRELGGPGYSFTVHGPEEFDRASGLALEAKLARAQFAVGISSFTRSQLYRRCAAEDWGKLHVVHCGLNGRFLAEPTSPATTERRMVCVGRVCEQKGQLLLVLAAAELASQGLDFELVLVGDGEMRRQVEELAARSGLNGRLRITGWADQKAVIKHIRSSRVLVLPSFAEGLPVVLMEAMALGRPVISTYVAGIPELVEPAVNGWLVPAGSVEELAAAMREALSAPEERLDAMGRAGRAKVLEQHDARKEAAKLAELFRQAVEKGEARA